MNVLDANGETPQWRFRQMKLSELNREPTEDEFFLREDALASLVREAIQNSLDAADGPDPVRVRFYLSGAEHALTTSDAERWLLGLRPHLAACETSAAQSIDEPLTFLAIEDFGTKGLEGNPRAAQRHELKGENEDFFFFWRVVGKTGKPGTKMGSRGLGKAVYTSSSGIGCVLGWTRRSDNQSLLMGQAKLGLHELEDVHGGHPVQHAAYGYFGVYGKRLEDHDFAVPTSDGCVIDRFRTAFQLSRDNENGFSLVIPYPAPELSPDPEDPRRCVEDYALEVINQYAYPILAGRLEVTIETPGDRIDLESNSLSATLDEFDWTRTSYKKEPTRNYLDLASWALQASPIQLTREENLRCDWECISIGETELAAARLAFASLQAVAFRVPVLVRGKRGQAEVSHFDVFMKHDPGLKGNVVRFVRQGLMLSEVVGSQASGLVCLVLSESDALARLLRSAENPAHTKWIRRAERLVKEFIGGTSRVRFVENAPSKLMKLLLGTEEEVDTELLAEFFPDIAPEAVQPGAGGGRQGGDDGPPPPISPVPPPNPRPIRLQQIQGGFSITRNAGVPLAHRRLRADAAYDIARGNPFAAWEPLDFRLDSAPVAVKVVGGVVESQVGNQLTVRIDSDDFCLEVRGFETTRDLIVRTRWLGGSET